VSTEEITTLLSAEAYYGGTITLDAQERQDLARQGEMDVHDVP